MCIYTVCGCIVNPLGVVVLVGVVYTPLWEQVHIKSCLHFLQWSFGVTCWEVFTCGRVPFSGIKAMSLLTALRNGERLERPINAACSDEM